MTIHDPDRMALRRAIRAFVALPPAFAFSLIVLNLQTGALFTAFAVFSLTVFADFGGSLPRRTRAYLAAGAAGMVVTALGTLFAQHVSWAFVGSLIVAFVLFFLGALRAYFAAATVPVLLPFVIAVTAGPASLTSLLQYEIGWVIGVLVATAAAILIWPARPRRRLERRVASALSMTARATRDLYLQGSAGRPVDPRKLSRELAEVNAEVRSVYFGQLTRPGAAYQRDRALMQLVDQVDRLQTMLQWQVQTQAAPHASALELIARAASCLDQCAAALNGAGAAPDPNVIDDARVANRHALSEWVEDALAHGRTGEVAERLEAGFHVRITAAVTELVCVHTQFATEDRPKLIRARTWEREAVMQSEPTPRPGRILREQLRLSSPWFRNSLRSGTAVALATAIASLTGVEHGFWVVLGALAALRFDVMGTGRTAAHVFGGTVLGFVVSVAIMALVRDNIGMYWALLPISVAVAAFTPTAVSYLAGQAAFTVYLIVFFAIISGPALRTSEIRLIDVAMGLAASLTMSALLWPRGINHRAFVTLRDAVHEAADFVVAGFDELLLGEDFSAEAEANRVRATTAVSQANEMFDLSLIQAGPVPIDPRAWSLVASGAGQLVAGSQLVRALAEFHANRLPCPHVADTMLATAHHVRARCNVAVDRLESLARGTVRVIDGVADHSAMPPEQGMLGNPIPRMRGEMAQCIESLGAHPRRGLGDAACALMWAEEWLVHFEWVARRIERVRPIAARPR